MNTSDNVYSRHRLLGAQALNEVSRPRRKSFFRRIDIYFPWLKLILVVFIGLVALVDLLDLTISAASEPYNKIRIAPMSKHVRVTTRVFKDKKLVALTFDDGPSPSTTPRLLDILAEKDVVATFFVLGDRAAASPDLVRRTAKEGHEVASHTMSHQNLIRIPAPSVENDVKKAETVIGDILGRDPSYMRPPYGNINDAVRSASGTPLILWSVDTEDWKNGSIESIMSLTTNEVRDGAIILMHDIYSASVDAVSTVVDSLRADGYEFVTISELASLRHVVPEKGIAYYGFFP